MDRPSDWIDGGGYIFYIAISFEDQDTAGCRIEGFGVSELDINKYTFVP